MKTPRSTLRQLVELGLGAALVFLALVDFLDEGRRSDGAQLTQADQLYAQGMELVEKDGSAAKAKFRESAAILEAELERADTAGMHFNRANALLQAGELGEAIASYRAAELRAPADERIAANLAEARGRILRPLGAPEPTALEQACGLWTVLGERTRFFIAVALGFAAIATLQLRARATAVACIVIGAVLAATVGADIARRASADLAVVSEATALRKGNGDGFEQVVAEALPEGTECRVREVRPGWIEVELSGGTRGWVRETSVARVE
ncbi:MAG: hypothetical protein RLZZ116_823 [Planctomycetota bacterium]|jgi:tetratricopeptide (TPR) repeat protein